MSKRGGVPYFMRQKSLRLQGERKKNDYLNRSEQNRQQASQVMTWCVSIALHDLYDVNITVFDKMAKEVMTPIANDYLRDKQKNGGRKALDNLKARIGCVMRDYTLPTLTQAKSIRDINLVSDQRYGGTLALAICLATLKEGWGYDDEKLQEVLTEADGNYKQFLQWAVDGRGDNDAKTDGMGQYYAYAKLAEVVRQLTGDDDITVQVKSGVKPVFVENF